MIPKKIHFCWFGGNPMPDEAKKCIESWRRYCPDYEIVEWNESNFDINSCLYTKQAYDNRKWAFVTDVVRLYALVNYGGIYMDTDVEVIKPLDRFLSLHAFSGFERENAIPTGIMACEQGFPLFQLLLDRYEGRPFLNADGTLDLTTNVDEITNVCLENGLILNNRYQVILNFSLFPKDYFCPKDYYTGNIEKTENTYTIHHFNGSWKSKTQKQITNLKGKIYELCGDKIGEKVYKVVGIPLFVRSSIEYRGLFGAIKYYFMKLK